MSRRNAAKALLLALAASVPVGPVCSAQRPASDPVPDQNAELLVFEVQGCAYCRLFRRDIAPAYRRSPRARDVPMRFIDVNQADISKLKLAAPLQVVPTVVLMVGGREIERISGYMGPEPFFHMISSLMRR
jgi:thioredoxin-related protein